MATAPAKKDPPAGGKRSFTWGIQASEIRWMKPTETGQVIEGSSSSDCIAITPSPARRRTKPSRTEAP